MELEFGHVFNLFDTNGRRSDIINALNLYLSILNKIQKDNPNIKWKAFPKSFSQYLFYKNAIEQSVGVFDDHDKYDYFSTKYQSQIESFLNGNSTPLENVISAEDKDLLDIAIEKRARSYTSNLCKLGFTTQDRDITKAGYAFLNEEINKDLIESVLPLTNTNIILIRQLLKLKIFAKKDSNNLRRFYSPFLFALYLLLKNDFLPIKDFELLVQYCSPYGSSDIKESIDSYYSNSFNNLPITNVIPSALSQSSKVAKVTFDKFFKNRKSCKPVNNYYEFYSLLWDYRTNGNDKAFNNLVELFANKQKCQTIEKAFGFGKAIFDFGDNGFDISNEMFAAINENNELLKCDISVLNGIIYRRFLQSKYFDAANEYGDTSKRIVNATGLFKFNGGIVSLKYKDILAKVFEIDYLEKNIFGEMSDSQYQTYESLKNIHSYFAENTQLTSIVGLDDKKMSNIISELESVYHKDIKQIAIEIKDQTSKEFNEYIKTRYPKEKVLELMKLFEDRNNDPKLKEYVNPEADVPTIYEYLTAIAWYYLSNKQISVYDSLNLTLNANFEPVRHASGGDGDIIVQEKDRVTMLEVTLLNGTSQGTNEYQPVLRHSCNLKVKYNDLETITFFIACTLDAPTIFNWRTAFSTKQMASDNSTIVENIVIMSFTNDEICTFLSKNVSSDKIVGKTLESFKEELPVHGWRDKIVNSLISK
jgi:uncharacterized FlaG/YvyC family protein